MRPLRSLILLLGTLVLVSGPLPARAVVGASANGDAHAGHVVMVLQRKGSVAGFCSGVVIGPTAVLTAAHCVPPGADVRIHYRDAEGAPVLLPVAGISRHPGYRADAIAKREKSIDLAVITTAQAPARCFFARDHRRGRFGHGRHIVQNPRLRGDARG